MNISTTNRVVNRIVRCPHCGRPVEWNDKNTNRPFCSATCKQIDLGAWASETYRLATPSQGDGEDEANGSRSENPHAP